MRGDDLKRPNSTQRFSALALTFALTLVFAGCGKNPFTPPPDTGGGGLPNDTPQNDTPQNTMTRFQRTYEYQVQPEYVKLLTSDFRYTFSSQTDQNLVDLYGPNWGKDDEAQSADHLFNGFTNSSGTYLPGATNITMALNSVQYFEDPAHPSSAVPDSSAYYKWVYVTNVLMNIDVPIDGGTVYTISAAHQFFLVRGDAAVLDTDQSATSNRWYIRRWDDLSIPLAGAIRLAAVNSQPGSQQVQLNRSTWGALKGTYLK